MPTINHSSEVTVSLPAGLFKVGRRNLPNVYQTAAAWARFSNSWLLAPNTTYKLMTVGSSSESDLFAPALYAIRWEGLANGKLTISFDSDYTIGGESASTVFVFEQESGEIVLPGFTTRFIDGRLSSTVVTAEEGSVIGIYARHDDIGSTVRIEIDAIE